SALRRARVTSPAHLSAASDLGHQLARQRTGLPGVLVVRLIAIRHGHGRRNLLEGERADPHARLQRDRHAAQIAQLERRFAEPARIEQSGRSVHDDSDAPQARAALEATEHVVTQVKRLLGNRQNKIARLQHERLARRDNDFAHDVLQAAAVLEVYVRMAAVLEHAEFVSQTKIDRATAELLGRGLRGDLDLTGCDVAFDVYIRENHSPSIKGKSKVKSQRVFAHTAGSGWNF